MIRETVTASPLYWPTGWKRTARRQRARFGETNSFRETQEILAELGRMGVRERDAIVSTNMRLRQDGIPYANQSAPADPGAAVWFQLKGHERVLACDRWDLVAHNLRAIALHIAAMRGQDRWGVGTLDQAFAGFVALPEAAGGDPWHVTLGIAPDASRETIEAAYRRKALECHPDRGGDRAAWDHLQAVRKIALQARGAA